jgi:peptidoglycan/xylan/chitin deacetylase (PgdA/CDA1 family)
MAGEWKQAAKAACAAAIHYTGIRSAMASASRAAAGGRRTLILAYHRVVEDFEAESQRAIPGLLVSAKTFERHIAEVRRAGYELVSLAEALEVNAGIKRSRRDLAVLTFDDGYRDNYEVAFPLLKKHSVPATIFLPTSFIGTEQRLPHDRLFHLLQLAHLRAARSGGINRIVGADPWSLALCQPPVEAIDQVIGRWPHCEILRMVEALAERLDEPALPDSGALLDWESCRRMSKAGISFGAHTVRHVPLHHEDAASVERELRESRLTIEREVGLPCRDFAYPNGYYSREIIRCLVRSGYRSAVTTEDSVNRVGGDPFKLRRKTLWENHSRGHAGAYSPALLACQLDGVFRLLGLQKPVLGDRSVPSLRFGGAGGLA